MNTIHDSIDLISSFPLGDHMLVKCIYLVHFLKTNKGIKMYAGVKKKEKERKTKITLLYYLT